MNHSFDIDHAKKYGLPESIILHNVLFWLAHNKAFNRNIRDGKPWTFNSVAAYAKLFPYWSPDKIRRYFESLEKQGVLISGNFNQKKYDKTKWHTVADQSLIPVSDDPLANSPKAKMPNANGENAEPIPDVNTDRKQTTEAAEDWIVKHKPVKRETKKPKIKKVDLTTIQEVVDKLKPFEPYIEKAINYDTKFLIENAIEQDGLDFVLKSVIGRAIQAEQRAKVTGEPKDLMLRAFFSPDKGDWRVKCHRIGEAQQNAAQGLESGFKSTLPDFSHIKYDDAPIDEEAWQTLTGSRN